MKKRNIILFLFITFLMIQTAIALEIESHELSVGAGINTIDLGKIYDGDYVSEINGSFYPFSNITGRYIQEIEFTSVDTRDNVLINITIPKNEYMNSNFSDIRFLSSNLTNVPYYISSYNTTHANVSLRVNVTAGSNSVIMSFGNQNSVTTSDLSSVFMYYFNNSSGQNLTGVLYTGTYTNIDYYAEPTTGASQAVYFYFNGIGTALTNTPFLYHVDSSSGGAMYARFNTTTAKQDITAPSNGVNGYSHRLNLSINPNGSVHLDAIKYNSSGAVNSTISINGNNTTATPFTMFGLDRCPVYDIRIYNTTTVSNLNFGDVIDVIEVIEAGSSVNIDVPNGQFSTLTYSSAKPGLLILDIYFNPHAALITQNGAEFVETAILKFETSPSPLLFTYQIALDSSFYSIIESGTSTGTITVKLQANKYYWRVKQPDGSYTEIRSFSVTDPEPIQGSLNFTIKNELTNATVSATVLISNETTTLQKTGSTITFNSSEVTAGNYTVRVNQTNFATRYYEVTSPGNYTLYILPTNLTTNNASVVYFSLIDNTNQFQYNSTKLEIIKQTPNGSILIQNSYFDASGFSIATLNQFDNYILKVVSDSGYERVFGNYIQAGQSTVQLVISEIILKENNSSLYGGFTYNLSKNETAIRLDWINPNNSLTEPLDFKIYKNDELMLNVSTDGPFGSINYFDNVDGEMKLDPDATYRIVFVAKTVDGTIRVNEYYRINGEAIGIDFDKIPVALRIVISLILLVLIASLFNITNAKFSAIVVSLVAAFLAGIQFLPIAWAVIIWVLFIAVVAYKTNR